MFTYVSIPGRIWHLWVRTRDYTQDQALGSFPCVAGQATQRLFGRHGQDGWAWGMGKFLSGGRSCAAQCQDSRYYARVDSIVLTTDENFVPP